MTITHLRSGPKLSRIVVHNDTVYLCGQVALDYDGDAAQQTIETLARIDEHLAEAGTDKSKMLAVTVYVKNIEDIPVINEQWNAWLADCVPPSRTCVRADLANEKILVEITVTAAK